MARNREFAILKNTVCQINDDKMPFISSKPYNTKNSTAKPRKCKIIILVCICLFAFLNAPEKFFPARSSIFF